MNLSSLRSGLSRIAPEELKTLWRRHRINRLRKRNRTREVDEIFSDIYRRNRWGGEQGELHSGSGSTEEHARRYAQTVNEFIRAHGIRSVVDLGCGDFRVARSLQREGLRYTGVDIVPDLIETNRRLYGSERVRFQCMNIIEERLPQAELCLVRQVLQHLSNAQISRVLANTRQYPYVLVTEHYPASSNVRALNLDKPCGEDVRIYDGSAVFLDAPPFDVEVAATLLDVDAGEWLVAPGERIRTFLVRSPTGVPDGQPNL
ncbi:MAG: class I SAM-dependent methyltransferase [Proteobacteria bacterium]|nr:class I SAM-dependent methyltransferase [Pseudomonadota bacterium]